MQWNHNVITLGGAKILIQSMTNTDTVDTMATVAKVKDLADAGSELSR
ncbi:flavodoxin-dependent (E)-4-hydroxy-3-methylbut-2-enyl-diphosphate synthase [Pseudomonas sp. LB3P81]